MYVYISSEQGRLFTVGFYDVVEGSTCTFYPESDHPTREEAARRCNYLNGGGGVAWPPPIKTVWDQVPKGPNGDFYLDDDF